MSLALCARRLRPIGHLALLASLVFATVPMHAQSYKADPLEQGLRSKGQLAKRYAKSGVGDRQLFEDYLTKYFFPSMTQPTPVGLAGLAKHQKDLFDGFLMTDKREVQKYVHEQALNFAVRVVSQRRYHPAVRNNALMILGKLQDDYAAGTPSDKANELLCKLAKRGVTSEKAYGYELNGALMGLERHTQDFSKLTGPAKKRTAITLYDVMKTDKLPMHLAPGVSDWIYLQTAKSIGNLGTPGPKGVFATTIARKAADENLEIETRAAIAAELARLKLAPGKVKAEPITDALFALADDIGESEEATATKFEDMKLRGGNRMAASGRGNEARRFRESDKNQGEMVLVREGLLDLLLDLRKAVQAGKAIAAEEPKAQLAAIEESITDAIRAAGNKDLIDLDVTDAVKSMASTIEANQPVPPAEEEAAVDAGLAADTP